MHRPMMLLLCLMAAMSGTPLRQAEAAQDLARSFAESRTGRVIEPIDGGVGDGSEEAFFRSGASLQAPPAAVPPVAAGWDLTPILPAQSPPGPGDLGRADRTASLPAGSAGRHAWLQCFLF